MTDQQNTITRTRTAIEVEEIEEELFLCANCGQAFDEDQMQTVGLDIDEDEVPTILRQVCDGCVDALFDYRNPDSLTEYVAERVQSIETDSATKDMLRVTAGLSLFLSVGAFGLGFLWSVSENLADAMVPATTAASESATAVSPVAAMVESMVPVMFAIIAITVLTSLLRGSRR